MDINNKLTTKFMESLNLEYQLQQRAIRSVAESCADAARAAMPSVVGEITSLHVAAHMDIEKTTESLKHVLAYKKAIAIQMLNCSNELHMKQIAEMIKYTDEMIKQLLGMQY